MIKQALIGTGIFIICIIAFTSLFFPYSKVLEYYAGKAAADAGITLTVGSVDANAFGAELRSVQLNDFKADSLDLSYSPFSIITRSIGAKLISDIATGEVELKGSTINLKTLLTTDKIPQIAESGLKGDIILNLTLTDMKGGGTIASPALTIPTDMGPVTLENLSGEIAVDKQLISITNLKSTGTAALDLRGNIRINQSNAGRSVLAFAGTISVAGMTQNIAITGTALNPRIIVN